MKNYELNLFYATKSEFNNLDEGILHFKFERWDEVMQHIMDILNASDHKTVYLFTSDGRKDVPEQWPQVSNIFVSSMVDAVKTYLINPFILVDLMEYKNFYLQEYPSYEDAYSVALTMKEDSPLCYND